MTGLLSGIALSDWRGWHDAKPFPHIVIDDVVKDAFTLEGLHRLNGELPASGWKKQANGKRGLSGIWDNPELPNGIEGLFQILCCGVFTETLSSKTGIEGLKPDWNLSGAGLHAISQGGSLDIHVDFNRHPETDLYRRLNLFLYLVPNWQPEDGGALELWQDKEGEGQKVLIEPRFNRLVCFESSERSWHGHPVPWNRPQPRLSLACYYYSATPHSDYKSDHSTVYRDRVVKPKKGRAA